MILYEEEKVLQLLTDNLASLIDTIMHWVLIGTIILGCIFLIVGLIMITIKIFHKGHSKHNRKMIEKYNKKLPK